MKTRYLLWFVAVLAALFVFGACGDDDGGGEGTNYPSAGEDVFETTTATIEIEITPEQAGAAPLVQQLETVELEGPATVTRSDPIFADDGTASIETEMVSMELRGTGPFGPIIVRQSPRNQSLGEVRQQVPGEDFPADSFFDMFVEIELPNLDVTAENLEPLRLEATLTDLPPAEGDEYRTADGTPVPIHTTETGRQIGRIVDALHIPQPPPQAATPAPQPTATEAPDEPTATTAPEAQPETEGSCEHGEGQSVLFISFSGLEPGEELTGSVTGPPDGVIGDGSFSVTAGPEGHATAEIDIQFFGEYEWTADGIEGSYEVGDVCPGPP